MREKRNVRSAHCTLLNLRKMALRGTTELLDAGAVRIIGEPVNRSNLIRRDKTILRAIGRLVLLLDDVSRLGVVAVLHRTPLGNTNP